MITHHSSEHTGYDNAGNMTGQTRYSNLAETTVVAATSYKYDHANKMTGIDDTNSSDTTLVSYGYTYNAAGLVTQEVRVWDTGVSSDTITYGYTNNDQLTSVSHSNSAFSNESFSWDANGNETGTGFTTSTGNEQTASPGYTYTYDSAGYMITATNTSTNDMWTYSYNFRGQMTSAVETDSNDTVLAQATYTYDALGRRIGIDENGTQAWTLYDGSTPVMDFNSSGSLETRYLNGPTGQLVDAVLGQESSSGTIAWYLPDRLGTIRDLIDNSGNIIDHVDYSAFGTQLDESDPSNGDRMMGFAGLERDTVTGLNLAVYRVQDPGSGRWTSQDPLGFAARDSDLTRYAANLPTGGSDPAGLDWLDDYANWFNSQGRPGFWEGLAPIWGPGREAYKDFGDGSYYWGAFHIVEAGTDVFLVRSLVTGAAKGLWKTGSHTWGATSKWCKARGWRTAEQELHHWLIPQRWDTVLGYDIRWLINQPWNLRRFRKGSLWHQAVHGNGPYGWIGWPGTALIGPPIWVWLLPISVGPRLE